MDMDMNTNEWYSTWKQLKGWILIQSSIISGKYHIKWCKLTHNTPNINTLRIQDNNLIVTQICWEKPLETWTFFCCRRGKATVRSILMDKKLHRQHNEDVWPHKLNFNQSWNMLSTWQHTNNIKSETAINTTTSNSLLLTLYGSTRHVHLPTHISHFHTK